MTSNILVTPDGALSFQGKHFRCALGKNGVTKDKKEGDGRTPVGCFPIREVFYRADRIKKPDSPFPTRELAEEDGWCDDSTHTTYNRLITLPHDASHEKMWREDDLYDIVAVLGYNDAPPILGKGSAIFLHIAREGYTGTAGCVALSKDDLLEILRGCTKETSICISDSVQEMATV